MYANWRRPMEGQYKMLGVPKYIIDGLRVRMTKIKTVEKYSPHFRRFNAFPIANKRNCDGDFLAGAKYNVFRHAGFWCLTKSFNLCFIQFQFDIMSVGFFVSFTLHDQINRTICSKEGYKFWIFYDELCWVCVHAKLFQRNIRSQIKWAQKNSQLSVWRFSAQYLWLHELLRVANIILIY